VSGKCSILAAKKKSVWWKGRKAPRYFLPQNEKRNVRRKKGKASWKKDGAGRPCSKRGGENQAPAAQVTKKNLLKEGLLSGGLFQKKS